MHDVEAFDAEQLNLAQYPLRIYEKLRYADTDRQGHVNNAVFASMLETGCVELVYDQAVPERRSLKANASCRR